MSWVAVAVTAAGVGASWYGSQQKKKAMNRAQGGYLGSLDTYNSRGVDLNQGLTGQLDSLAAQRRGALTGGLRTMGSDDRFAAGSDAANRAVMQGGLATQMAQQGIPFGSNYTTSGSGATANTLRSQQMGTNARLGNALAYSGAIRGNQAVENYDQAIFNRLGNDYTSLGRQTGEAQQVAALRQAEMDRIWSQISNERGRGVQNSMNAGNNAMMLGQALQLAGGYGSSYQANKPAQQQPASGGYV